MAPLGQRTRRLALKIEQDKVAGLAVSAGARGNDEEISNRRATFGSAWLIESSPIRGTMHHVRVPFSWRVGNAEHDVRRASG